MYKLTPRLIKMAMDEYPMNMFKGMDIKNFKLDPEKGLIPFFQGMMPMFPTIMPMPPMPFMPFGTPWGWSGSDDNDKTKEGWETFNSNLNAFWKQMKDMYKASLEASKGQWNAYFDQCMEMQESFADSLPDEMPFFTPVSPKEYLKKDKEFREKANRQAMEQADSFFEFASKRQEYVEDMISEGVKNTKTKIEEKKKENANAKSTKAKAGSKKSGKAGSSKKAAPSKTDAQ